MQYTISKTRQVDLSHSEQLTTSFFEAVMPMKQLAFYFFPSLGDLYSYHMEIRNNDPSQQSMIPYSSAIAAIQDVKKLAKAANLSREVTLYASLSHYFSSFGGPLSFTHPTISIPYSELISPWTEESNTLWKRSEPEVRFLIARELARIKTPTFLIHSAIKVSLLALLYFHPIFQLSYFARNALHMTTLIVAHCFLERRLQRQMDIQAIEILSQDLKDAQLATKTAITALNRMKEQNLCRLKFNKLCHLYITEKGDNILDLTHDPLSQRIIKIASHKLLQS